MTDVAELCFTQLLGQEKAKGLLLRSLASERVPHAYLFKGPAGVGKRLFARGLAAVLNCQENTGTGACTSCPSCRKMLSMNHPDFVVVRPEKGVLKIDQIRKISRELHYPPYESPRRVVVLEEAESMRREAANSLLKTLEEPPENNLLILTADSSRAILPTLTSRCQVVPFTPLSQKDTLTILIRHGIEQREALLLARLAEGSPGRALLFHRQDMVEVWNRVVAYLGTREENPDLDVVTVLAFAEEMAELKEDLVPFLGLLRIWLRDQLLEAPQEKELGRYSPQPMKSWSSGELFARLQAVDQAERQLARNCNRALVCEVLLFTLQ
ncbi:MAG: DNA polymerase III subunit delta' [Desulforhopalus sp.]|jgi:DNA polymerase-3 subunit delta'|nr:DNA polymerase III subunit delta' [Desulforhopalus sp.]